MLEEIANTSRKIAEINITNRELIELLRYEEVFNYVSNLQQCRSNNVDNNDKFTNCIFNSVCPEETDLFKKCVKKYKDKTYKCYEQLISIQDCMKVYTNTFIAIMEKVNRI
jgi:hypothetical protein